MVDKIIGSGIGQIADIQTEKTPGLSGGKSFGEFLTESLEKVSQLQKESEVAVKQIADGASGPALQDAMIAAEKADIAFKLMMEVRQKILDAYRDISSMQV